MAQTLQEDTTCRRCGYNLRGLSDAGRCPECNAPVVLSLLSEQEYAVFDPAWINTVARGSKLTSVGGSWGSVLFAASAGVGTLFGEAARFWVATAVAAGAALLLMYGAWLTTSPYAAFGSAESTRSARRVARACVLLFPPSIIAVWFGGVFLGSAGAITALFAGCPGGVGALVGALALCRHVEGVSTMVREDFTRQRARAYARGFAVSWAILWLGVLGFVIQSSVPPRAIGVLALGILVLALPTYLTRVLAEYALLAHANWAAAEASVPLRPMD